MSLLMDALRKAEEAKRRAAQESDSETTAAPGAPERVTAEPHPEIPSGLTTNPAAQAPETEAKSAPEAPESPLPEPALDVVLTFDDLPDAPQTSSRAAASLDIPLGFYLDVTTKPEPEPEPVLEPELKLEPELAAEPETTLDITPTVAPSVVPSGAPTDTHEAPDLSVRLDAMPALKLMDVPADDIKRPAPTLLLDTADSTQANELIYEVSQQIHKLTPTEEPATAEPDPTPEMPPVVQKAATSSQTSAAADSAKDKQASRRSARAVFAAKSGAGAPGNKRPLILGSVAAGLLVFAAGGWYLLSGVLNTGNQYNIPASFDNTAYNTGQPELQQPDAGQPDGQILADADTSMTASEAVADSAELTESESVAVTDSAAAATALLPAEDNPVASMANTADDASPANNPAPVADTAAVEAVVAAAPVTEQTAPAETVVSSGDPGQLLPPVLPPALPEATSTITVQSASPIQISRSQPIRNPDMQMLTAWSAYQQGDYAAARMLYQQSLAINPDNRDALLGIAASAMQQGDMASARQTYARLLSMNPRDPLARTGMLETTAAGDPIQRESDLKALLNDHPDLAAISYALGNLYASQQRWHDAQQAYYNALLSARTQASGPVSPDYAFNLAISLERINQPQAALNFYREAKTLSNDHTSSFDMAILEQRLQVLERLQP